MDVSPVGCGLVLAFYNHLVRVLWGDPGIICLKSPNVQFLSCPFPGSLLPVVSSFTSVETLSSSWPTGEHC